MVIAMCSQTHQSHAATKVAPHYAIVHAFCRLLRRLVTGAGKVQRKFRFGGNIPPATHVIGGAVLTSKVNLRRSEV